MPRIVSDASDEPLYAADLRRPFSNAWAEVSLGPAIFEHPALFIYLNRGDQWLVGDQNSCEFSVTVRL